MFVAQPTRPVVCASMASNPSPTGNPMHDTASTGNVTDRTLAQGIARERYFGLRDTLVRLKSASPPSMPAIDAVIRELEQAQLDYKATHGLIGNNPIEP
jgi:hypothetical protein